MKIEIHQIIEVIKKHYPEDDDIAEVKEAFDITINALEKQMPKEPTLLKSMKAKRCPVCKCVAESDCEEYGYCQHCGQALKWPKEIEQMVKIVRCGECKHYTHKEIGWCDIHSGYDNELLNTWTMFNENDYCSYGES